MQHPTSPSGTILALDVGERRIGVAISSVVARLASPLKTLERDAKTPEVLRGLVLEHQAVGVVVGLPRGLDGQHTAQTAVVETFGAELQDVVEVPVYWQDEALTSKQAEAELMARGKPYAKGDIDALSAVYILEDFLRDHPGPLV